MRLKKILLSAFFAAASFVSWGQPSYTLQLYPSSGVNVEMDVYIPEDFTTGKYIVVCPGGGYSALSRENEGKLTAEWLNTQGIAAGVLFYRLPDKNYQAPVEDVLTAIALLRDKALERLVGDGSGKARPGGPQYVKAKTPIVGVMGFSAGGHLASVALTQYTTMKNRPDFGILFYPVITMDPAFTHAGSRKRLIGSDADDELTRKFSSECRVTSNTPPTMILSTADDKTVPIKNSLVFFQALTDNGVRAELHVYPTGGHGWGFKWGFAYRSEVYQEIVRWVGSIN